MNLNEVLDRITLGRATIGDTGFVVNELRAAKREKRRSEKALKLMALNDSRIIGKLKREKREMWKALSRYCVHNQSSPMSPKRYCAIELTQCEKQTCYVLKLKAKVKR